MLKVDRDLCTGCGLCEWDCLPGAISTEDGFPKADENCFFCGHCEAICPAGAVKLEGGGTSDAGQVDVGAGFGIDAETMLHAIKVRRSVRHFKRDAVPREMLEALTEAGRFSPTANNSQNVKYIVVGSDKADEFSRLAMSELRKMASDPAAFEDVYPKAIYGERIHYQDDDFMFKGGRAMVFAYGPHVVNAAIATANMELMAEAMGLGVVYIGIFIRLLNVNKVLRDYLGLSDDDKVWTCLSLGFPDVEYQRSAPRRPADVRWI